MDNNDARPKFASPFSLTVECHIVNTRVATREFLI
jgi:hypothetical protein